MTERQPPVTYLLCAQPGLTRGGGAIQVRHYIGHSFDFDRRIAQHFAGEGASLTRAWVERGIEFRVARVWPGQGPIFERMLKYRKHFADLCPNCNPYGHALIALPLDLIPDPLPTYRSGKLKIARTMAAIVNRVMRNNRSFTIRLTAIAAELRDRGVEVYAQQLENSFQSKALASYKIEHYGHGWRRITRKES
jgi:hypothetical protein